VNELWMLFWKGIEEEEDFVAYFKQLPQNSP
jgi:hypothetical protein